MKEQTVTLSEDDIQVITKALQGIALKLEELGGDTDTIQKLNNLAYKFQELSTNKHSEITLIPPFFV